MENKILIDKIDQALKNVEMPDETRDLLIDLKSDILKASTSKEKQEVFLRWSKLILGAIHIFYEISKHT